MQLERIQELLVAPLLHRRQDFLRFAEKFKASCAVAVSKRDASLACLKNACATASAKLAAAVRNALAGTRAGVPASFHFDDLKLNVQKTKAAVARHAHLVDRELEKRTSALSDVVRKMTNVRHAAWLSRHNGLDPVDAVCVASRERRAAGGTRRAGPQHLPVAYNLRDKLRASGVYVSAVGAEDGADCNLLGAGAAKMWHSWHSGPEIPSLGCPEDHFVRSGGRIRRHYRCGVRGARCALWCLELSRRSTARLCLSGGALVRACRARSMERSFRLSGEIVDAGIAFSAAVGGNNRRGIILKDDFLGGAL